MTPRLALVVVALALPLWAGCTESEPSSESGPRLEPVDCPQDVEILVVPPHSCGYVVTEGRSGAELRIFTVAVEPPSPTDHAPVLETGTDLGMTPDYGGLVPIAQRTGRLLVLVDLPGTGHSTPSLECPEVEQLSFLPDEDMVGRAVADCRQRLESDGVETTDATPRALAQALYDVTRAYQMPRWVLMGHGTSAVAALDLASEHSETVEALVLDSVFAGEADLTLTIEDVVAGVDELCRADPSCRSAHGGVADTWTAVQAQLASEPVTVRVDGGEVVVDQGLLARLVRWLVAPADLGPGLLPALLDELAAGEAGPILSDYVAAVLAAPPLCVGYLPKCEGTERVATGAVLSAVCPGLADSVDWAGPCTAWGMTTEPETTMPAIDVPTLSLHGRFNPFAPAADARAYVVERVPDAFLVEVPTGGHNVLPFACVRDVRNDWLAGPLTDTPSELSCPPLEFD